MPSLGNVIICRENEKCSLRQFYFNISQKVLTLSGRIFTTLTGPRRRKKLGNDYIMWRIFLHYRAVIALSGDYYIIG